MPSWPINFDLTVSRDIELIERSAFIRATARTIRGIPLQPRTEERLHRLNIMRAVRGTTGIEGVDLTEEEVDEVLFGDARALPSSRKREEQEVLNAHELMQFVEQLLHDDPDTPLTENLVKQFHDILTRNINYERNAPGSYRSSNVSAGDYQTPDHADVPRLMADFFRWLNGGAARAMDPITQAIVAHFLLISIHPFGDGNGRASRGVESLLLYKAGVNVRGFYSLANYYYRKRPEYIDMLTHVRFVSNPDVTPFVQFALTGLAEDLEQVHEEILQETRLIAFHDYARERIAGDGGGLERPAGRRRLNFVLGLHTSAVSLSNIRTGAHGLAAFYRGVGPRTLARDLTALQGLGLIVVEGGTVRGNLGVMDAYTAEARRRDSRHG